MQQNRIKYHSILVLCALGLFYLMFPGLTSCDTKTGEPAFLGYQYYPIKPGHWVVYEVDSTVYDDFVGETFHFNYYVKEQQVDVYTDSQGRSSMRLERYYRSSADDQWVIKDVWSTILFNQQARKTEENQTFVKLVFPVQPNKSWNGNLLNSNGEQDYTITELHQTAEINGIVLDSTLTVLQKDFVTLIGEEFQTEMYATGIGLVHREFVDLELEIDGTVIRGVDYTYTLVEFGQNN